jgi:hypothetical protein
LCGTLDILRSSQPADAKRRAAKRALADFIARVAALLEPAAATPSPKP